MHFEEFLLLELTSKLQPQAVLAFLMISLSFEKSIFYSLKMLTFMSIIWVIL